MRQRRALVGGRPLRLFGSILVSFVLVSCARGEPEDPSLYSRIESGSAFACAASAGDHPPSVVRLDQEGPRAPGSVRVRNEGAAVGAAFSEGFGSVADARILESGRIVVADGQTQRLHLFERDGRHVISGAGEGEGPGEFEYLRGFVEHGGDSIYAVQRGRMSLFAGELDHLRTMSQFRGSPATRAVRVPEAIGRFHDGSLLLMSRPAPSADGVPDRGDIRIDDGGERPHLLVRGTAAGRLSDSIAQLSGEALYIAHTEDGWLFDGRWPFSPRPSAIALDSTVLTSHGRTRTMVEVDRAGRVVRVFGRCGGDPARLEDDRISAWIDGELEGTVGPEVPRLRGVLTSMPYPSHLPGYGDLLTDGAGLLWALDHDLDAGDRQRWDLYDLSDGTWLDTVQLPAGFEMLDVDAHDLLARHADQLGRESVVLFPVERLSR